MSIVVNLSPLEEANLRNAASEKGLPAEELARQLITGLEVDGSRPVHRVSDELRAMGREALREHAAGLTEDFPA
ncbi:MAG: hypothetical protein ABJA67_05785 [Chthonomonadales bacterium]